MENNKYKVELKLKKGRKTFKLILILFMIILIIQMAIFSAYVFKTKGNIAEAAIDMATDVVGKQEIIFCLLLGISEDINSNLTDTIILAGYNPNIQKAFLLSIPRDTFIKTNVKNINSYNKINSVYQKGTDNILKKVEEITNLKIENYVVVNNKILKDLVDSIGGVEFDVPMDMNYDDKTQNLHIHLKKGLQRLDGDKAEQLVRFRHNNNGTTYLASYGDNDYGRMRTQREFIKEMTSQIICLNNIPKIREIASAIFNNLKTNMLLKNILAYIPYGLEFDVSNLKMEQLPGKSKLINDIWFFEYNKKETKETIGMLLEYIEYYK